MTQTSSASWKRAPGAPPLLLGHRGARLLAPENTLLAFELAVAAGADGVELDVRLTRDRQVVVFHDATLERMTEGREVRAVRELTLAEAQRLELQQGASIPSLAEVLAWAAGGGHRLNVELKADHEPAGALVAGVLEICTQLAHLAMAEKLIFSSFSAQLVARLSWNGLAPCAWLTRANEGWRRHACGWRLLGAAGLHPQQSQVTRERVERWHERGAFVGTWTVNQAQDAARLSDCGVDTLIGDDPALLVATCRS